MSFFLFPLGVRTSLDVFRTNYGGPNLIVHVWGAQLNLEQSFVYELTSKEFTAPERFREALPF